MDITTVVNCCFGWFLVVLAMLGYYLTYKRIGERWSFWNVLAIGWGFFAVAQTLLLTGAQAGAVYIVAIWLSSYIIVIASMVLLFVKLSKNKSQ